MSNSIRARLAQDHPASAPNPCTNLFSDDMEVMGSSPEPSTDKKVHTDAMENDENVKPRKGEGNIFSVPSSANGNTSKFTEQLMKKRNESEDVTEGTKDKQAKKASKFDFSGGMKPKRRSVFVMKRRRTDFDSEQHETIDKRPEETVATQNDAETQSTVKELKEENEKLKMFLEHGKVKYFEMEQLTQDLQQEVDKLKQALEIKENLVQNLIAERNMFKEELESLKNARNDYVDTD
ncbi:hypothetical protein MP638_004154 [Amoeboaphelidium occidentale]|nr:hypothetical protein MP638_004154 [Amoeboaphelidium occidentale]